MRLHDLFWRKPRCNWGTLSAAGVVYSVVMRPSELRYFLRWWSGTVLGFSVFIHEGRYLPYSVLVSAPYYYVGQKFMYHFSMEKRS